MSRTLALVWLLLGAACTPPETTKPNDSAAPVDEDGDGWLVSDGDCDDGDATVHPEAVELCDGLDQDCDEEVDEDASTTWYTDADGDGYGDEGDAGVDSCEPPDGAVDNAEDCDDADEAVNPAADEVCDGDDDDCDGAIDDDPVAEGIWYYDADGDGFGGSTTSIGCEAPEGYVEDGTDCDDTDPDTFPGADEVCGGADEDCDGQTDEDDAVDAPAWYTDADADGFGDPGTSAAACTAPDGTVADATDCDDTDVEVFPGGTEVCDGEDDDCDGSIDEDDAADAATWYADTDADGYGDAAVTTAACAEPSGYVADATDCDDADAEVSPSGTEVCDGEDDDCDGTIDEDDAADAPTWYGDTDTDGYGDSTNALAACSQPSGYVADATDCDDAAADTNPSADETCDGEDDDCDGATDEDEAIDALTWYADTDSDGYGASALTAAACEAPSGYVADATDCDDGDAANYPGADEVCDGEDDDCDAVVDEDDAVDALTWYADADLDGYGDGARSTEACTAPTAYVSDASDCDDTDADTYPGADETCDGEDDDCDGSTDESDAVDASMWYVDTDADGFGAAAVAQRACTQPSGYVALSTDCDDSDGSVSPSALEACDGEDDDCDGVTDEADAVDADTWYVDADSDGYGLSTSTSRACTQPSGYVADATDCDDGDLGVNPAADEYCDGEDDDCDGTVDEADAVDAVTWYRDADNDTYGTTSTTQDACTQPSGYVSVSTDCDDTDNGNNPAATETCDDEDNDCDGSVDEAGSTGGTTWFVDSDGDGYGLSTSTSVACDLPSGYAASAGDCDDGDDEISPAATEMCDSVDNDCDGSTDEASAADAPTWYRDADSDGYGSETVTQAGCTQPSGYIATSGDCDDGASGENPGATEICSNSIDEDCDGTADDGCPSYVSHCGTISASETWSGDDIHLVTCDVYVQGSASPTLTIEDGAEVQFSTGAGLLVGNSSYGSLTVSGTTDGVVFTSSATSPAAGAWDGITVGAYNRGTTITGATIEYAGNNNYGNIYANNSSYSSGSLVVSDCVITDGSNSGIYLNSNSELDMSDTTVSGNADYGVYVGSSADLETTGGPSFTGNTLTDNDLYPIYLPATYVDQLDASSSFTGNGTDRIYVTGATLTADAAWQDLDADYQIASDVTVGGTAAPTLTIEDGAALRFGAGIALNVGSSSYGGLDVEGTTLGVTFTGTSSSPGAWDGIYFGAYTRVATIDGATVEYAGANGYGNIYAYNLNNSSTTLTITDSIIREGSNSGVFVSYQAGATISDTEISDNADYGLWLEPTASLAGDFTDNTVTGNTLYPVSLPADYVDELDSSSTFSGNGDDLIRVTTDTVATDATWQLLDVDHEIVGHVYVQASADPTLTISDGVTLYFAAGIGLHAGYSSYGAIAIAGSTLGVTLTSNDTTAPLAGDWDGLWIGYYDSGSSIAGATIAYGGANNYGNVYVYRNSTYGSALPITDSWITASSNSGVYLATSGVAVITGTIIDENTDYGVYVDSTSALSTSGTAAFTNNEVTANGLEPVRIYAAQMVDLDDSSTYSGNTSDRIYVTGETISSDATWQDLDVDWYVATDITVQATTTAALTIDPGTTVTFARSAGLSIGTGTHAILDAIGTSANPITFTSAQTAATNGDWDGITIGNYDAGSTIQYAEVSYGGANTRGNLYFYYSDPGTIVDNCTISDSSYYGIYRTGATPTITNVTYSGNTSGTIY